MLVAEKLKGLINNQILKEVQQILNKNISMIFIEWLLLSRIKLLFF